jgi:hypothetical protein
MAARPQIMPYWSGNEMVMHPQGAVSEIIRYRVEPGSRSGHVRDAPMDRK